MSFGSSKSGSTSVYTNCCFCGMLGRGRYPSPGSMPSTVTVTFPNIINTGSGGCCDEYCERHQSVWVLDYYGFGTDTGPPAYHECSWSKSGWQQNCSGGEMYSDAHAFAKSRCYETGELFFETYLTSGPDMDTMTWQLWTNEDIWCKASPISIPFSSIIGNPGCYACWSGYTSNALLSW